MNYLQAIHGSINVFLSFWWLALLFAAIPPAALALVLKMQGTRWHVALENGSQRKVRYWILGLVGGLAGGFTAVLALVLGTAWFCYKQYAICHDGQAGIALIFTIPMLSLFGSAFSLFWTWCSLRLESRRLWASIFSYSGQQPGLNFILAGVIQLVYWALFSYCLFWLTINRILL